MEFTRRTFLAGLGAATLAALAPAPKAEADIKIGSMDDDSYATLIDLTKCDGCKGRESQKCVSACRETNAQKFPEPDPAMLKDYWPQKMHEDWSTKREVKDRLTPYNWTFVQKVKVEHEGQEVELNVPRRCMHCDNPACVKLCPFGSCQKDTNGPVHIDAASCFGGAKCRTVCPWSVPQRQAGVGIYTKLDPLPMGGGVMYKCDLCRDRLAEGKNPACMDACPNNAIKIGRRSEIFRFAEDLKAAYGGHIYGQEENGGTSTLYVSKVPFEKIDEAIVKSAKESPKESGKAMRMHKVKSKLEDKSELAVAALLAPIAGVAAAFAATIGGSNKASAKPATKDKSEKAEASQPIEKEVK